MELMIIDQNGWSKTVTVNKAITQIGTAPENDIPLISNQIAPVHLQLLYAPQTTPICTLTNLAGEITIRTDLEAYRLPKFETMEVRDGDQVELGDFRIVPKLPFEKGIVQTADLIDASISIPDPVLRPNTTTTGQLIIVNQGDQPDCQFNITVQGFPEDSIKIDPIPLMFPGAQEHVRLQLFHRGVHPPAGSYDIVFTITAPRHYPDEELRIKQQVFVTPVYSHSIEISDDLVELSSSPEQPQQLLERETDPATMSHTVLPKGEEPAFDPAEPKPRVSSQKSTKAPEPGQDISRIRVVRKQPDDYWDEE